LAEMILAHVDLVKSSRSVMGYNNKKY